VGVNLIIIIIKFKYTNSQMFINKFAILGLLAGVAVSWHDAGHRFAQIDRSVRKGCSDTTGVFNPAPPAGKHAPITVKPWPKPKE
jgi:hypothetical protein